MERLNGKIAMQISKMMRHRRERTNDSGQSKGEMKSLFIWVLISAFHLQQEDAAFVCILFPKSTPDSLL